MSKLEWTKFYQDKWLSDEKLRSCSFAARGLWIDIISLSCKNDRRGYLQLNGRAPSPEQLARMTGGTADEVSRLLQELLDAGVPSVTPEGIIYCRRIVADAEKSAKCSVAGQNGGGNPSIALKRFDKGQYKGENKGPPKQTSLLLPLTSKLLESAEFVAAWERFKNYRAERKTPMTHDGWQLWLNRLEPYGVDIAIQAIEKSIESGWTGVFPERFAHGPSGQKRKVASDPSEFEKAQGLSIAEMQDRRQGR